MGCIGAFLQRIRRGMKLDRFRELGRQYPLFCFLLLALLLSTVLLNRRVNNSARQHHRSFTRGTPMSICCKWVSVYGSIMCFFYSVQSCVCLVFCQIYTHYNGVLVLPGWSRHLLLLSGARVSAPQHLHVHQAKEQGGSESPSD